MKRALITGITGQDGSYLTELLISKGYQVHGIIRRSSTFNTGRIDHLYQDPHETDQRLVLHYGDLTDSSRLVTLIEKIRPDEVYHLAAQSHVRVSFDEPEYTGNTTGVGTTRLLEAIRMVGVDTRYYQASSLGDVRGDPAAAGRGHPVLPAQPVWGGEGLRVLDGAELPRGARPVRGQRDPVQPRVPAARGDVRDPQDCARGRPDRGRGRGERLSRQSRRGAGLGVRRRSTSRACGGCCRPTGAADYVLATGTATTVREFTQYCFERVGLDWEKHVRFDETYLRPTEVDALIGDASKAQTELGWKAQTMPEQLAHLRDRFERVGLDWEKHVRFDETYLRPTEVDALIGDASKAQRELGWKAQTMPEQLAHLMVDAEALRDRPGLQANA